MSAATELVSAEQLYQMPDDGYRYELVKGELIRMSPAGFRHGRVSFKLAKIIERHNEEKKLGVIPSSDTGFKLKSDPDTVRVPDIGFVSNARFREIGDTEKFWPIAPDLAVEVLSPDDRTFEVEEKIRDYLNAGTEMVWIVSTVLRTVAVYRKSGKISLLTSSDILDGGDVLPGSQLTVSEIFD